MSETRLYFAYGSNINLDHMAHRCPKAEVVGPVTLDGYELTFRGRADGNGVGNIEPKEGASVPGVLWRITPDCEQALDRYEGVPRLYVQKDVTVRDSEGNTHTVMAYVMTDLFREHALPSPFYFQSIRDGYRQNGMDEGPLADALKKCRAEVGAILAQRPPYRRKGKEKHNER